MAIARTFCKLMMEGKVQGALRYFSCNMSGGVLKLDDLISMRTDVKQQIMLMLHIWHPQEEAHPRKIPCPSVFTASLLRTIIGPPNPVWQPEDAILQAGLHTHSSTGPAGLDAHVWKRMCSSFKSASHDLCKALTSVGRRICTTHVHSDGL